MLGSLYGSKIKIKIKIKSNSNGNGNGNTGIVVTVAGKKAGEPGGPAGVLSSGW